MEIIFKEDKGYLFKRIEKIGNDIEDHIEKEVEVEKVPKKGLLYAIYRFFGSNKGYEYKYYEIMKLSTNNVKKEFNDELKSLEKNINEIFHHYSEEIKKTLFNTVENFIYENLNLNLIDKNIVYEIINNIFSKIDNYTNPITINKFTSSYRGILSDEDDIDDFISEVESYRKKTISYVKTYFSNYAKIFNFIKKIKLSKEFTIQLDREINKIVLELENKKDYIEKYNSFKVEVMKLI